MFYESVAITTTILERVNIKCCNKAKYQNDFIMDPFKKSRIPTRHVRFNNENYRCSEKENLPTATTKTTSVNLNVPIPRQRIVSDTALLPTKKKAKMGIHLQTADKLNRVPLGNLHTNLVQDNIQKKERILKSISFKDSEIVTVQKKLQTNPFTKNVFKNKQGYERNAQPLTTTPITKYQPSSSSDSITSSSESDEKCIPVRKNLTPFPKSFVITFNLTESGSQLFDLTISPIKANPCTIKSTVIVEGIPDEVRRLAKKKTLLHKTHPGLKRGNSGAYCLDIYTTEYLDDIVRGQMRDDWKCVLNINYLNYNNPDIMHSRAAVVNWLIRAQDYLNLSQSVLFTTIRLFDRVLEHLFVDPSMCQLVGLVIMWIVQKFEDQHEILTPEKLSTLCNGAYLYNDFLKMEKKLLTFFKFDLKISDVTVYIAYYLKMLQIESDLLLHSAFYILECYALKITFSTVVPSIQAAAAVRLALKIIYPESNVWSQIKDAVGYYHEEHLDNIMKEMLQQLHRTQDPACEYRQPYKKYTLRDKVQASIVLLHILVAT